MCTDAFSLNLSDFLFGPDIFSLNYTELILESHLDYENQKMYIFTIEAAEMLTIDNTEPLTSTATVTVQVIPVNEHAPVLMSSNRLVDTYTSVSVWTDQINCIEVIN